MAIKILEKDSSGHTTSVYHLDDSEADHAGTTGSQQNLKRGKGAHVAPRDQIWRPFDWRSFLLNMFMPAGFPATVSSDYTRVQIYNGLQAFCSSLASLIASRAVLEGHGIGNAEASATHAVVLTVVQDAFSRLTTILGAYYLGTLLYPEAKAYRLVADVTNDIAIVLDLLSPQLSAYSLSLSPPFIVHSPGSSLRVAALCLSGAFRALCGVAAGGAKAAITLHFAQDGAVPGDVGDLSAKDGSKETVLALAGMLCGSMMMSYLHTPTRTYTVVAILLILHVWINYVAVRVVVMKSLNRQRTTILWAAYSAFRNADGISGKMDIARQVLAPSEVASNEYLFGRNSTLLQYRAGSFRVVGHAKIGVSFSSFTLPPQHLDQIFKIFSDKKYVISISHSPLSLLSPAPALQVWIILKEGHTQTSHLEAWTLANTIASRAITDMSSAAITSLIEQCKIDHDTLYKGFLVAMQKSGWHVDTVQILTGAARTIRIEDSDDRKTR